MRPMLNLDTARVFRYETSLAHSMREPTFPAASAKFLQVPSHNNFAPLDFAAHVYTIMAMPSFGRAVMTHYRGLADRRAAAVLLAIRLYEVGPWNHADETRSARSEISPGSADRSHLRQTDMYFGTSPLRGPKRFIVSE